MQFVVPPELSIYLSIVGDGNNTLLAHTVGDAALVLKDTKRPHKELIYLPVSVSCINFFAHCRKFVAQNMNPFMRG